MKNLYFLDSILKKKINKIYILVLSMVLFSLLYMLLPDNNFEGVNKYKEIIKEEVIKNKVQKEIVENYAELNNYKNDLIENYTKLNSYNNNQIEEKIIDKTTKETEDEVKKEELNVEKVEPNMFDKYFNRLYFAIITGCLLGYGDIYPVSNLSKLIAGIQGLITIILIIY